MLFWAVSTAERSSEPKALQATSGTCVRVCPVGSGCQKGWEVACPWGHGGMIGYPPSHSSCLGCGRLHGSICSVINGGWRGSRGRHPPDLTWWHLSNCMQWQQCCHLRWQAHNADWKEFYGDVTKELPPKIPEPWGHSISISVLLMLTMLAMLLHDIHMAVTLSLSRMHLLFGTQKDRIWLKLQPLEVNLLHYRSARNWLWHSDTSFECLVYLLMVLQMCSVTIVEG